MAEHLFAERGYTAVTLRDIAEAVGLRHASLYHHVPGGKEALFIEVTERTMKRHAE
ncbi:MAG: TetR/AcrR family transcriptional regulator, partial [Anaerolineae bacterium]|nr:TetR/AcrR family transcriptional regulator [Anaerolineae bacterium]